MLVEQLAKWSADDLFLALNKAGVPCGPINSIADGVALAERLGLEPRVTLGDGDRSVDLVRNPITFSAGAPPLRPAAAASSASTPTRSGRGWRRRDMTARWTPT